jgi:hypothetical protein
MPVNRYLKPERWCHAHFRTFGPICIKLHSSYTDLQAAMVEMSTAVEQSNDIPHLDSCENIKGN